MILSLATTPAFLMSANNPKMKKKEKMKLH